MYAHANCVVYHNAPPPPQSAAVARTEREEMRFLVGEDLAERAARLLGVLLLKLARLGILMTEDKVELKMNKNRTQINRRKSITIINQATVSVNDQPEHN